MSALESIPGIGKASLELLEAAGFANVEALARAGVDELAKELERANTILQISKRPPARGNVEKWISSARKLAGLGPDRSADVAMPVNYELASQVMSMLASAPYAIPLPARFLVEQQLAVGDIPAAILLNRYSGDLEVRVENRIPAPKPLRASTASGNVKIAESIGPRMEIDQLRLKPIASLVNGAVPPADGDDSQAAFRSPAVGTNNDTDGLPRRVIRGVMHHHPVMLGFGALLTLALAALLPIAIVSGGLLLLSREYADRFGWVPEWLLAFPISLPVFGLAYLFWAIPGGCRICGQKLLYPRMCMKNSRAHHVPWLGYIIPLCVHILLFKWFRCTYCGTPVRLKK